MLLGMENRKIRITIDGKLAFTVEQWAQEYGLEVGSVTSIISRGAVGHDAMLDGRKKLYLYQHVVEVMKGRPGRGANLRARGARAGA